MKEEEYFRKRKQGDKQKYGRKGIT